MSDPKIYVAFRFHGNYYHSYRGDTPDEFGFGKDIRIIRQIIKILDDFNANGVDVCGTWDFENYFSLETIMPQYCPDIIDGMKRRVQNGKDEIQIMSYNNGLVGASTAVEFELAIKKAVTNDNNSGVKDIFGKYFDMVRPQEMMYTPAHLKLYPEYGINNISLFYSSIPFNGFSNFIPKLPFEQQYNPLTLCYPGIDGTMTLMPAYNTGDIIDNISMSKWIKRMRKNQLAMENPTDLLLIMDMDADDEFWMGIKVPVVQSFYSSIQGLSGLVNNIKDIDYVRFTTPGRYLENHKPIAKITIGQDTADGSCDGYRSWAEKWSNQKLWTGLERTRIMELQVRKLMEIAGKDYDTAQIESLLELSVEDRLKLLSTTHFGMASPVMNVPRLEAAKKLCSSSFKSAAKAFKIINEIISFPDNDSHQFSIIDYARGVSNKEIKYEAKSSKALVKIVLDGKEKKIVSGILSDSSNNTIPCALMPLEGNKSELLFVHSSDPDTKTDFSFMPLSIRTADEQVKNPASQTESLMMNEFIRLEFDSSNKISRVILEGTDIANGNFVNNSIVYNGKRYDADEWKVLDTYSSQNGLVVSKRMEASIYFPSDGEKKIRLENQIMLVAGLGYIFINMIVDYPKTDHKDYSKHKAERLGQSWDGRWHGVMPCEITPDLIGVSDRFIRVWKHNFINHVSCFDLDYSSYSKNCEVDSFNNQVTNSWIAVNDDTKGLLIAQTADKLCSMAFCNMRTRMQGNITRVLLNPFGSYDSNEWHYQTAYSGLGKIASMAVAEHLDVYAPAFNGRKQEFSLMLAPYAGIKPPQAIQNDALAYSYPYMMLSKSDLFDIPRHREWNSF